VTEAMGRLLSYILRISSPVSPRKRLKEIIRQLSGIGGGRPTGFGPQRVRSLPDGIAQMLQLYIAETDEIIQAAVQDGVETPIPQQEKLPLLERGHLDRLSAPARSRLRIGDLCPECGQATFINVEGCRKCDSCGYSEC
jgi:ribonucleoside-diphosphate reductase alpha chain